MRLTVPLLPEGAAATRLAQASAHPNTRNLGRTVLLADRVEAHERCFCCSLLGDGDLGFVKEADVGRYRRVEGQVVRRDEFDLQPVPPRLDAMEDRR